MPGFPVIRSSALRSPHSPVRRWRSSRPRSRSARSARRAARLSSLCLRAAAAAPRPCNASSNAAQLSPACQAAVNAITTAAPKPETKLRTQPRTQASAGRKYPARSRVHRRRHRRPPQAPPGATTAQEPRRGTAQARRTAGRRRACGPAAGHAADLARPDPAAAAPRPTDDPARLRGRASGQRARTCRYVLDSEVASIRSDLLSELRIERTLSNSMILVPLLNPKFATVPAEEIVRTGFAALAGC